MKSMQAGLPLVLVAVAFSGTVSAQSVNTGASATAHAQADLDVTMSVVEQGKGPEGVIQQIQLPAPASTTATTRSAAGLDTANKARSEGGLGAGARGSIDAARGAAQGLIGEAGAAARDAVKSSISGGAVQDIPTEVRENLPVEGILHP